MRRLTVLAALLALPVVPAHAAPPPTVTYVAERLSPTAHTVEISGGAGASDHEWALAAVVAATVDSAGRFTYAEGGLFFGAVAESGAVVRTPVATKRCADLPTAAFCANSRAGAGIGFVIWWDDAAFNRVFVVLRGRDASASLDGTRGWRLRRWTGPVHVVADGDYAGADTVLGASAGAFAKANAVGGVRGSLSVGHPPCRTLGYTGAGTGVVQLKGGADDVTATCAVETPPAAYARGSTEWELTGEAAGMSDVPARLVVIEPPAR